MADGSASAASEAEADRRARKEAKRERKERKADKKARKKLKKDAKRAAKKARRPSDGSSSSTASSAEPAPGFIKRAAAALPAASITPTPNHPLLARASFARLPGAAASLGRPIGPAAADSHQKRVERAARFTLSASEAALHARAAAPAPTRRPGVPLRGQSLALEKSYVRLTAMPRAEEVRPLAVLRDAFEHVLCKWRAEKEYGYACEQLKSIRQDLVVQNLTEANGAPRARFAAAVYEAHARIALQAGDLDEFGQCNSQLIPLHARGHSAHVPEFAAYRLLHCAALRRGSVAEELQPLLKETGAEERASPAVAQALRVALALGGGDFFTFFREARRMHNQASHTLLLFSPYVTLFLYTTTT